MNDTECEDITAGEIIVWDTEFCTDVGVRDRHWEGLYDTHPVIVQIAAARVTVSKEQGVAITDTFDMLIQPRDAYSDLLPISDYFSRLTGIKEIDVTTRGASLADAVLKFHRFCNVLPLWSYGRADMKNLSFSCFLNRFLCPIEARQCFDVRRAFIKAGVEQGVVTHNTSGSIANALGSARDFSAHYAMEDVKSIVEGLNILLSSGRLRPSWLVAPLAHRLY